MRHGYLIRRHGRIDARSARTWVFFIHLWIIMQSFLLNEAEKKIIIE